MDHWALAGLIRQASFRGPSSLSVQLWRTKLLQTRSKEVAYGTAMHRALERLEAADLTLRLAAAPQHRQRLARRVQMPANRPSDLLRLTVPLAPIGT